MPAVSNVEFNVSYLNYLSFVVERISWYIGFKVCLMVPNV